MASFGLFFCSANRVWLYSLFAKVGVRRFFSVIPVWLGVLLTPFFSFGQGGNSNWDFGLGLGVTGYTGDYNLSPLPRSVHIQASGLARCRLSNMYALRLELLGGAVRGAHDPERYYLPQPDDASIEPFTRGFLGLGVSAEIHFLPFQVGDFRSKRTGDYFLVPYATMGVGGSLLMNEGFGFFVPMGVGIKWAISGRLTLAPELRFLKFFTDRLDSYRDWPSTSSFPMHNADWVSMVTVTCTYRVFIPGPRCPAYNSGGL